MNSETGISNDNVCHTRVVLNLLSRVVVSFSAGTVVARGNGVAPSTMAFGVQVTKWKITEGSTGLQM